MFKYIGLSKRTHPLDHKRYTAIAEKQTGLTRVDVSMLEKANSSTHHRLSRVQDVETAARLTQRLQDLAQIRAYFQTQRDVTFLGMYGWGAGCQVAAASGQGISEYDAIVYQKNGRIVVEKIGSCWQLFRQQAHFSGSVSSEVVTSGGDVFLLHPHFGGELSKKPSDAFFQPETRAMSPSVENTAPRSGSSSPEVVHDPVSEVKIQAPVASHLVTGIPGLRSPVENRREKGRRALNSHSPQSAICMSGEDFLKQMSKISKSGCTDAACSNQACQPIFPGAVNPPSVETTGRQAIPEGLDFFKKLPNASKDPLVVDTPEGCPCCLNAIDLDELAGLGKILNNTGEASHTSFELAQVDGSWGVAAGLAGPFAMLGLVAAYRNVTGAYATRQVLKDKLAEIERLIAEEATPQRLAYRYCLQYSLFDANWNMAVPGVLNGVSSASVLSTLVVTSPLAIPALGAYAIAQAGRGIYDTARSWNAMTGHAKIDQITCSKRRFYMSNTTAFTCMGMGALLVALAPLTFGATLIPGLCLLIPGTLASGVLNNIWPRKFRPRNGDLGVRRETLTTQHCETLIAQIRDQKTVIKTFKKKHMSNSVSLRVRKVLAKLAAVLPFCKDRAAKWLHAVGQEQIAASMTQMTEHQSELFASLGMDQSGDVTVSDLLTGHLKKLRYQQYGLVDFYWGLKRFEG